MISLSLRHFAVLLPLLLLGLGCALPQGTFSATNLSPQQKFVPLVFKNDKGEELRYRFLKPLNFNPGKSYPLVFFMHGSGERGSDNTAQIKNFLPQLCSDEMMFKYPCFVIAPQVPGDEKWCAVKGWNQGVVIPPGEIARPLRLSLELIDSLQKEYKIDTRRMYVIGLSMGGYGTWDALWRRPGFFAAAVPICGGGDPAKAPLFVKTPIWAFHGVADPTVPIALSREMIEAVKNAGGHPRLTEYPGVGHDSWTRASKTPELYKWLFAQRLR